jgi:YHS domain-containing protein
MKFIKCEFCGAKIPKDEKCELASHKKTISGEVFVFCCARCANEYEKKQKTRRHTKA